MRKFLQMCAEVEQTLSGIYTEFARQCSGNPRLREIWETLARDEIDHSAQILMAGRLSTDHSQNISMEQVHQLRTVAAAVLREARDGQLSPDSCLKMGLRLEDDFKCVHAHCAIHFIDEKMASMFRALAWEDERHSKVLSDYCKDAGLEIEKSS